jgi:hypothetical protein
MACTTIGEMASAARPTRLIPNKICNSPAQTVVKQVTAQPNSATRPATITVRPAAGYLTCSGEPPGTGHDAAHDRGDQAGQHGRVGRDRDAQRQRQGDQEHHQRGRQVVTQHRSHGAHPVAFAVGRGRSFFGRHFGALGHGKTPVVGWCAVWVRSPMTGLRAFALR